MKFEIEMQIPSVPNFIRLKSKPGQRQGGWHESPCVAVEDLSVEQLQFISNEWEKAFFQNAQRRRQAKASGVRLND